MDHTVGLKCLHIWYAYVCICIHGYRLQTDFITANQALLHIQENPIAKPVPHEHKQRNEYGRPALHYRSKVWGHPDNFMVSTRTHTFIHEMSYKMNRKYSQDIDKVRNKDFNFK